MEPPKHRTSIARTRFRLSTPAQLRVVDKLLEPKDMGLPDAAYEGGKLANDSRYGTQGTKRTVGHEIGGV